MKIINIPKKIITISVIAILLAILINPNLQAQDEVPSPFANPNQIGQGGSANPTPINPVESENTQSIDSYLEEEQKQEAMKMQNLNAIQSSFFFKNRKYSANNINIKYKAGETHKIRLRYAMTTMFVFDKDSIIYYSIGDEAGFSVSSIKKEGYNLGNILIIKPILIGVDTNLTVIGSSGKIYTFYIFSTHFTSNKQPALTVFISDDRKIGKLDVNLSLPKKIESIQERSDIDKNIKEKLIKLEILKARNKGLKTESVDNGIKGAMIGEESLNSNDSNLPNPKDSRLTKNYTLEDYQTGYLKDVSPLNLDNVKTDRSDDNKKTIDYSSKEIDDGKFIKIGDETNHIYIDKSKVEKSYYQNPRYKRTWWSLWLYKKPTQESKDLESVEIFDDGKYTYFKYDREKAISKFPVTYKVVDGYDNPINSRIVGNYIIAEDVGRRWTLRLGDEYVCVANIPDKNKKKEKSQTIKNEANHNNKINQIRQNKPNNPKNADVSKNKTK